MSKISALLTIFVGLSFIAANSASAVLVAPDSQAGSLSSGAHGHQSVRKSLSFGHHHKHKKFITKDYVPSNSFATLSINDIHQKALNLATDVIGKQASNDQSFFVRSDSYTDPQSGLIHVYVKQTINGLIVEDGDLNVVFSADGQILSYGSSLYAGDVPLAFTNPIHSQQTFSDAQCQSIRDQITAKFSHKLYKRDQLVFMTEGDEQNIAFATDDSLETLQHDLYVNCNDPSDSPYLQGSDFGSRIPGSVSGKSTSGNDPIIDARLAALHFVKIATADDQIAFSLSQSDDSIEKAAASISSTFEQSMRPDGRHEQVEKLHSVPGTTDAVSARLGYIQTEDGSLNLVWRMEVPMDHAQNSNFYQITVDATTGEVRTSADWVASAPAHAFEEEEDTPEAYYKVMRWGLNDPSEGNRTLEAGAFDESASPYGWHTVPNKKHYDDTRGNNVIASAFGAGMEDWQVPTRPRPTGKRAENGSLVFDFKFPWRAADKAHEELSPDDYADASTVNLFYTLNMYHDLMYLYGFTPAAGNFEEAESKEGGRGGDAIIAYSISSAGINNADFTTPPDGSKPRVRMYKWHTKENRTERDGDFEEGIIVHEMTHGISTRLTGGPSDSSCLGWGESGGMGEGWGDYLATIIRRKSPTRDIYTMGSWASHNKAGIRKYPYSTNLTLSPETYKTLDSPSYWGVHTIGEVWSAMLYDVEEGLRSKLGWSPDLFPPNSNSTQAEQDEFWLTAEEVHALTDGKPRASKRRIPRHGNTLAVQLVIDGMKLQPCRPKFFDARDAIIQADKHLTGGANECLIWERFAKRGLGTDAKVVGQTPWGGGVRTNGHKVPTKCAKD
ncbi:hypothetical protein L7F22_019691 [Adiantum nelumboides]|nr:hypothetical protein [Adiantum nelumboides]